MDCLWCPLPLCPAVLSTLRPEKVTEKAVRRLSELVPTYKHQLRDKEVFSNFMALTKQAKTFAGREVEQAVDEWKAQLQQVVVFVFFLGSDWEISS